ncbi:amidohydrolase [Facklamia sp. DSM 111018]|uniref:Amidohydrolase n=1 Tax=Facklamia lactis TaxID=2749967 RepID=A0ABS0LQU8_9LACT|nr:M20 family metallopeptidase [Facklamia lactis]MBG9985741.1 amidohydrolase [Facklamia lactis]
MEKGQIDDLFLLEREIICHRRELHQIPEIGLELPKTIAYVKNHLRTLGLSVEEYINGNGLSVVIEGEKGGKENDKVIGLRADMDGLPIVEKTGLAFASHNDNMHACGHDGHTAVLLGVASFLNQHRELFKGKIKLIFQPGEEYPGGALPMIQEGVLEQPKVTRMLGFHIGHLDTSIPPGKISYKEGPMMASMDRFAIKVCGKGYHGAYPENADDPIIVANQIVGAIQTIKSRNIKASEPVVISVTHVSGGFNQNVIPDDVFIEGTVRAISETTRQFIEKRLQEICRGMSIAFGVECCLTYDYKYPALVNDSSVTFETVQSLTQFWGESKIEQTKECMMGGEDFAFFSQNIPSCFLFMANPRSIKGQFNGHHHAMFDFDEDELINVAASFVVAAFDYLNA